MEDFDPWMAKTSLLQDVTKTSIPPNRGKGTPNIMGIYVGNNCIMLHCYYSPYLRNGIVLTLCYQFINIITRFISTLS
jgi:hypothetical protein